MTENKQFIGRMLSANSRECVIGTLSKQDSIPAFGSMLRIPLKKDGIDIYAVVTDITLEEDGFLRSIAGNAALSDEIILDAQENRNVPIVVRAVFVGFVEHDRVLHQLPPRPPVTLTEIYPCTEKEICGFTRKLGYLRLLLTVNNVPVGELPASHIRYAAKAHAQRGEKDWAERAVTEVMDLMQGDPAGLVSVLGAIGDADIFA